MFKQIAIATAVVLGLTGCSGSPEPTTTLNNGQQAPTTSEAVVKLVSDRYKECFAKLPDVKYGYAKTGSKLMPGVFTATSPGIVITIDVGAVTAKGVLPTVPAASSDTAALAKLGC